MSAPLEIEYLRRIAAAEGWATLGDLVEAASELDGLPQALQRHPHVLAARWAIDSKREHWCSCKTLATDLVQAAPDEPQHWIWLAYATRRAAPEGIKDARSVLLKAHGIFPAESMIMFNLACYDAQLGSLSEAKSWLQKVFSSALKVDQATLRYFQKLAAEDPDLERIRASSET